jgi:hypothetical protein
VEDVSIQAPEEKGKKKEKRRKKIKLWLLLLHMYLLLSFKELVSSIMIKWLPWEPSLVIQMRGMIGRRTSEG